MLRVLPHELLSLSPSMPALSHRFFTALVDPDRIKHLSELYHNRKFSDCERSYEQLWKES